MMVHSVVIATQINIFLYPFLYFPNDKHLFFSLLISIPNVLTNLQTRLNNKVRAAHKQICSKVLDGTKFLTLEKFPFYLFGVPEDYKPNDYWLMTS